MRRTTSLALSLLIAGPAIGVAACGGGSKPASHAATTTTHSTSTQTTSQASPGAGPSAVSTGPVRAALNAVSHDPVINGNWVYTITASDASGHPLTGTVLSEFVFAGQVVGREAPPVHRLKDGHLRDVIVFPPRSLGVPLVFQTVVRTNKGTVTLDWPVKAKR